ncbi:MAG: hypothetical protein IJV31_03970, partial [Clostridia bacterium]|nr:hypothetical protein [Clostridia bacterium]
RGTCREVGKEDTLYMELKVLTNGYLKDGKITVNSDNMYLQTAIVKDNEVKNNYIAANTKTIELNQINNGTQKILQGTVRSGNYSTAAGKTAAIGNDTTKYSKVNSVTLTGTHVAQDGTETKIEKTVYFDVDWYGETKTSLYNMNQTKDINGLADTDDLKIQFTVNAREEKQELILSKSYVEGTLPEVNGYAPIKVEVVGANVTYTYDETTRIFTAQKEATVEDGIVKTTIARENTFTVNATYPKEAYEERNPEEVLEIKVPVKANYEGYNNTNEEFTNPYKSNTAQGTVIVTYRKPAGKVAKFEVKVGKYVTTPYVRYIVTKKKPLRIYNGTVETEKDDKYIVTWTAYTGTEGAVDSLVMKERKNGAAIVSDRFVTTDAKEISMEDITTNIGIYFSNPETMLGADGYIKVYNDETDELIETFTKENWGKYNSSNPYKYENSVKHIRIETSVTNKETSLTVYNVKELNDEAIVEKFEKEEFDNLQYIKSTIEGYLGDKFVNQDIHSAGYEESLSVAKLSISKNVITTQETENNFKLVIKTETDENSNEEKWVNGAFLLKLPKEILDVNINKVTIDNSDVEITSYEVYEQDGAKFIKILTENEKEASYSITVDANITPDPRIATTNTNIELYASNENMENYYYKGQDQYDINGNLKTTETVNKVNVGLSLVSPQSLLTNQTATNYDKDGSKTVAPQEAIVDKDQRQANVNINVLNNYSGTISQVQILGKIPFEENTYVLNTNELGSDYSTTMTNAGIILPDELKAAAKVYYSTNENPTKDLVDQANGWTETPEDFSQVKTFLIDLGDHVLARGESQDFYYTINLPIIQENKLLIF